MRCNIWILIIVLFSGFNVFSQEKYIQHTVSKGETVSRIAQQYHIKSSAVYEINPDAKKGLKLKSVLLIPIAISNSKNTLPDTESLTSENTHTVQPKETLYGITKQYGVTAEDLYRLNPSLKKSGLKKGDVIKISDCDPNLKEIESTNEPIKEKLKNTVSEVAVQEKKESALPQSFTDKQVSEIVREVLPKETKYAIAKEYGLSIAELEKANPILETEALKIGQKLSIPVKEASKIGQTATKEEVPNNKPISIANQSLPNAETVGLPQTVVDDKVAETEITHEVLPKETKYGIAREFGISVKELESQNPKIAKNLLVGDKLTIRTSKNIPAETPKKEYSFSEQIGTENPSYDIKAFHGTDFLDQLVSTASENIGTRYRSGGTTKDGFDCSGLMYSTFGAFDIQLPRTSFEQSQYGVKINNEDAQKGDLIFFKTNGRRQINHVGMVVEVCDGEIKFIHASVGGGVIISSVKEKYYSKRVTQINRIL